MKGATCKQCGWSGSKHSLYPYRCPKCKATTWPSGIVTGPEYKPPTEPCAHLGEVTRQTRCSSCGGRGKLVDVHSCPVHVECTLHRVMARPRIEHACISCADFTPRTDPSSTAAARAADP